MEVQNAAVRFQSEVVWPDSPGVEQRGVLDEPTGLFWPNGEPILLRDAWRINMQGGC